MRRAPGLQRNTTNRIINTTINAMGTQKLIAEKIIAANADYLLSLKDNHPTLHEQVKNWFEAAQSIGFD